MKRRHLFTLAACAVAVWATSSAQAVLLVYEPFDYNVGSQLTGQSGGQGFNAAWTGRENNLANVPAGSTSIQAGSLAGPAGLVTQGGHALITGASGTTQPARTFSAQAQAAIAAQEGSGGSLWVSFLAQRQGAANDTSTGAGSNWLNNPYPRGVNVSLFNAGLNDELTGIGNSSAASDNTWSIIPDGSGAQREGAYNPAGGVAGGGPETVGAATYPWNDLHWAVVRIDYNGAGGNQDMRLWLDPDPTGAAPLDADAVATILGTDTNYRTLLGVGGLRPFVGNQSGTVGGANFQPAGVLVLDEIRVGTEFRDMNSTQVIPEPATFGLLALAGAALAIRRRR